MDKPVFEALQEVTVRDVNEFMLVLAAAMVVVGVLFRVADRLRARRVRREFERFRRGRRW